jgi:hypothetical protein
LLIPKQTVPLSCAEDEELVLDYRTTDTVAEGVIDLPGNIGDAGGVLLGGDGIEGAAGVTLPERTVPGIGATLIDDVAERSTATAKFGGVRIGLNGNFLDGFKVLGLKRLAANAIIVVVESIDQEAIAARAKAIDGEGNTLGEIVTRRDVNRTRFGEGEFNGIKGGDG